MAKYAKREFRIGDYYLTQRSGTPAWHRTWYCEKSKQTRRVSLGTDDFDKARKVLEEWYMAERMRQGQDLAASEVLLKDVFKDYLENHAVNLRSTGKWSGPAS